MMKYMRNSALFVFCSVILLGCTSKDLRLTKEEYIQRCEAIWTAQIVGHMIGLPFEHHQKAVKWVNDYAEMIYERIEENGGVAYMDDDWYYEIANLNALEKFGPDMTLNELGTQWIEYNVGVWGSSGQARKNLIKGIPADSVGHPKYNRLWFTMGAQNRCDLYGMLLPGLPNSAAMIARKLGIINSYAEGTDGGVLMSAMISKAFYEKDVQEIIKKSIEVLHPEAPHRKCIEKILFMAERGHTPQEIADAIVYEYSILYPATNSAVPNLAMTMIALYFGEGEFLKTMNLSFSLADYMDSDCNSACAAVVLAAAYGMEIIPDHLIEPLGGRMRGDRIGPVEMPLIDTSIRELAERTADMGYAMLSHYHDVDIDTDMLNINPELKIETQPLYWFDPNDFATLWDKNWKMKGAGFGAPGGGFRGIRGGTFLDEGILSTFPRDEVQSCYLYRRIKLDDNPEMILEVGADPGRSWRLEVFVDNQELIKPEPIIDGGPGFEWLDDKGNPLWYYPHYFPPPQNDYQRSKANRKYQTVQIDLSEWANQEVLIRLYMSSLVLYKYPGNAYWRKIEIR
jgi:hypothetical protein